uniref:Thioredoxin domain-containing protein n=1 Tax=Corethron hystrix TaxID=216773 RepID=A0A7S1G014_9STRA
MCAMSLFSVLVFFSIMLRLSKVASIDPDWTAVSLTTENYEKITSDKAVFIIFCKPSVFYCQDVKPQWDRLAGNFNESNKVLIGFVNCEDAGANLCARHAVVGVPTYKYGEDADSLSTYQGGRMYPQFSAFVFERLLHCSVSNLEACVDLAWSELWKLLDITKEQLDFIFPETLRTKKNLVSKDVEELQKVLNHFFKDDKISFDSNNFMEGIKAMYVFLKKTYEKYVTTTTSEL